MDLEELKARNKGQLAGEQDSTFLEEIQAIRELLTELRAEQVTVTGDYKETSRKLLEMNRKLEEASSTYQKSLDSQTEALEALKKTFLDFENEQKKKNEESRKIIQTDMETMLKKADKFLTEMEQQMAGIQKTVPALQNLLASRFMELNKICKPKVTEWINAASRLAIVGNITGVIAFLLLRFVIKG